MKIPISIKIRRMIMVAALVWGTGDVHAQNNDIAMTSSTKMNKMAMEQGFSMIPEKPEDISPLLYGEKMPTAILPDAEGRKVDLNKQFR